ncbi:MAG: Zn-ribbon domain-containing OB-fold protein [Candidatus Bathyarchaeia archaeon]
MTARLSARRCESCGFAAMLEHLRCPRCKREVFKEFSISTGELVTYTVLTAVAEGCEKPLYLGFAEFEGKLSISAQLAFTDPAVGMKVKLGWGVLRKKKGETVEGLKLEPL